MFPINRGEVRDRQVAPSKAFRHHTLEIDHQIIDSEGATSNSSSGSSPLFSPKKEALYRKRYEKKYDIHDDPAWLKINPPEAEVSSTFTESSSSLVSGEHSSKRGCERIQYSTDSKASSSDVLSEVLVLPRPIARAKVEASRL